MKTNPTTPFDSDYWNSYRPAKGEPVREMHGHREHAGGNPRVAIEGDHVTGVEEFDYSKIDQDLGNTDRGNPLNGFDEEVSSGSMELFVVALGKICSWMVNKGECKPHGVYVRSYVLAWMLKPEMFDSCSQAQLAKRIGVTRAYLGKMITSFRDEFHFINRHLRSEDARKSYSDRQKRVHKKRRKEDSPTSIGGRVDIGLLVICSLVVTSQLALAFIILRIL